MIKALIAKFHEWRHRRRFPLEMQVERLRNQLMEDDRWLASNEIASLLTGRYYEMLCTGWEKKNPVSISELREIINKKMNDNGMVLARILVETSHVEEHDKIAILKERIAYLENQKFARFNNEDCWIYQKDGDNHLNSVVCPVVISAKDLQDLMVKSANRLTPAELERLAIATEEHAEVIQVIGKILRHGYDATDPNTGIKYDNRAHLERELGDTIVARGMLINSDDIDATKIVKHVFDKERSIQKYLRHQKGQGVGNDNQT